MDKLKHLQNNDIRYMQNYMSRASLQDSRLEFRYRTRILNNTEKIQFHELPKQFQELSPQFQELSPQFQELSPQFQELSPLSQRQTRGGH